MVTVVIVVVMVMEAVMEAAMAFQGNNHESPEETQPISALIDFQTGLTCLRATRPRKVGPPLIRKYSPLKERLCFQAYDSVHVYER